MAADANGKFLMFRGKPLVRERNAICYGDMSDKYVLYMLILSNKTIESPDGKTKTEVPDKILVQIISTDTNKKPADRMEKQFEKSGLMDAFDIGLIWLNRLNEN